MAPTRDTPLTPYTPYSHDVPISQRLAYNLPPSQQPVPSPLPAPTLTVELAPLTTSTFAPYGTVISTPLPPNQNTIPYPPPQGSLSANQGSALKYPSSNAPTNNYHLSPSGSPAKPALNTFSCFPRPLRSTASPRTGKPIQVFDVRILERHPYTTQTFIPLGSSSPSRDRNSKIIIIVAPTLAPAAGSSSSSGTPYFPQATSISVASAQGKEGGVPDLQNLKAFVAEPGQGVMYGAGTWHAPMVIVGGSRVDFVVSQWMSGKEREDCQEVEIEGGVCVDLGEWGDGEVGRLWKSSRL